MVFAQCPRCQTMIDVGMEPAMGAHFHCVNCGSELEIVWLYPVELDLLEEFVNPYQGELEGS